MKIAFVTQPWDRIVPILGGAAGASVPILTYQIAKRLAQSGNHIIIYGRRRAHQQKSERDDDGIEYRRISGDVEIRLLRPLIALERLLGYPNSKHPLFASRFCYLGFILQVARDLRREKCDIIHLHNFSQFVHVVRAFNAKSRIVLHMHIGWLSQLDRSMIEKRLRQVDLVIGCSEYITEKIRQRFPQFASRCKTIRNGVDVNLFVSKSNHREKNRDRPKRLLFVGRISPEKGVHVLLEAFQQVVKSNPDVELELIGEQRSMAYVFIVLLDDDPKVSGLASYYNARLKPINYISFLREHTPLDLATKMIFSGPMPHAALVNHYCNADVFILPSVCNEAFPLPPIEAMACRLPVIATRSGGIPESVEDGKTGLLVERGNAAELARAILKLLADEDLRKSMGMAGRERVLKHFTWEKIAADLEAEYTRILSAKISV
jgi:glycosyltransferase involved in cell wall biosynthesis